MFKPGSAIVDYEIMIDGVTALGVAKNGEYFVVDVDCLPLLVGRGIYTLETGYFMINARDGGAPKYLHRYLTSAIKGYEVDHINGNRWDNRLENLRLATRGTNSANSKLHHDKWCKYKGVDSYRGRSFRARCCQETVGYFDNPEDAARAYDKAAIARWGEFARTNQMEGLLP